MLAIFMVLFCQSRTNFIALLLSIFFLPSFLDIRKYFLRITKVFFLLIILFILIFSVIPMSYLSSVRDTTVIESSSWQVRVLVWRYLWDYIKQKPLLGSGGYKEFYYSRNIDIDSGYFWFLYNFGLLSLLVYILIFGNQLCISFKYRKYPFSYLSFTFSTVILITSITNAPFQEPRLNLLIAITMALLISSLEKSKRKEI
ncbi:MAG: O-antigen ligase family protein [Dictyoglomus turgidum]|uniref:O-antigen ligase family protein n=1 Tax=Dictyoglomus turgidum TaxID=513050 RepID=UPI003C729630